jgi:hypothetical protein
VDPGLVKIATGHASLDRTDHYTQMTPAGRAAVTAVTAA